MSEETKQMAAMTQSVCDVVAMVYAENQVLLDLLEKNGTISKNEFDTALTAFQREHFQALAQNLTRKVIEKSKQILQKQANRGFAH